MKALPLALLLAACGTSDYIPADASPCGPVVTDVPDEPGVHIAITETPVYQTNPPASGEHYPVWARWSRIYDQIIPRGYYVHNLEHGGVVFLYNCPDGCPDLVDDLTGFTASLPVDPACSAPLTGRWLVTPDPLLPAGVTVAAVAWGWTYTASCFDDHTLRRFYGDHLGHAPESSCGEGAFP